MNDDLSFQTPAVAEQILADDPPSGLARVVQKDGSLQAPPPSSAATIAALAIGAVGGYFLVKALA